jgi:hypothetical protein
MRPLLTGLALFAPVPSVPAETAAVSTVLPLTAASHGVIVRSDVYNHLVTIECETPSGRCSYNGSVAIMDDNPYLLTRQSFLMGAHRISFRTRSGKELRPVGVELSPSQDLARLPLEEDIPGLSVTGDFEINAPVYIPEVSLKQSQVHDLEGVIIGIGPDVVEVSAVFDPARSGSPVLNEKMEVIALTSYLIEPSPDLTSKGTKFAYEQRRLCSRVANSEWQPVNWRKYNQAYGSFFRKHHDFSIQVYLLISLLCDSPFDRINTDESLGPELLRWKAQLNHLIWKRNHASSKQSKAELAAEYSASMKALLKLCREHEERVATFLEKKRPAGYLRKDFEVQLELLAASIQGLNYVHAHGQDIRLFE